jgi:predicted nuclease of predicted toxin-antitoxin system
MKIVADESVNYRLVELLRQNAYEVVPICDVASGISDKEVIHFAQNLYAMIITEDKDFGELVFSHQIKDVSIVFLRYDKMEEIKIGQNLLKALAEVDFSASYVFVTITAQKIRLTMI